MSNLLGSLSKTIHASLALAILLFIGLYYLNGGFAFDALFWSWLFRYIHVIVAIMWIGLLWYFNFVQIPNMGKIPDDQKPAIGKVIAPAALFYFRWAAAFTILSGFILAHLNGYLHDAMTLSIGSGIPKHTAIGIGMWLGVIMAYNVWFVIWPNQKRALGIVDCEPELKAKSAKTAMLFSRTNTLLSLPMLLSMVATIDSNIGSESNVFVLENNIAVFADLAFNSGSQSTIPKALFWLGQITNQTLYAMITPSHIPIPIAVCFGIPDPILNVIASCKYPFK